ncbi:MAG: M42 family metallopeptidase [Bacteroidota bacterium]
MSTLDLPMLKKLCEMAGAPGFEQGIRQFLQQELEGVVDDLYVDNIGNLIAVKKGKRNPDKKRVMLAAHMDEIGFIVTHIDDHGFVRFSTLGGFDPKTLTAQRVWIHGRQDVLGVMGSKPIHVMKPEERKKTVEISDFFVDTGLPAEEVKKLVEVGDPITRERAFAEMGECVNCKSIDNRVSVYILLEVMKALEDNDLDVYGAFTVQEEVGIRGATVAAHHIEAAFGLGIDTTIAFDLPGAKPEEMVTKLGDGVAIKIMDASTICDPRMVQYLKDVAEDEHIRWQPEVLTAGGTDTAALQRMGKPGAIAGAVSIPTRHLHQVIEMAHQADIGAATQLLLAALRQMGTKKWS